MTSASDTKTAPPAASRGARRRTETRRRLLAAARAVFAREGLENATIAQITSEADVGFGTFYLHFTTKEDAYRAVVTDGFDELADLLAQAQREASERGAPWWSLTHEAVAVYCHFAARNRELFVVMFTGGGAGIGLARELQERFAAGLAAALASVPARASDAAATLPWPYPPAPVAIATIAALTRSVLWWLTHEDGATLDSLIDTMSRYVTAALWGRLPEEAR